MRDLRLAGWYRNQLTAVGVVLVALSGVVPAGAQTPSGRRPRVQEEVPVTSNYAPAARAQNSPSLAADPRDRRFLALANRLDAPDFGCALQVSGDGGRGWVPAKPIVKLPAGAEKCYAPEVAFDSGGVLYYLFVGLKGRGNEPMGVFLTTSADRARTFTHPRRVLGPFNFMVRMAIDPDAGPRGRIHLVWLAANSDPGLGSLPTPPNPILSAHSDDGGKTFSKPVQVSDPRRQRVVAPALALGPGHTVHVAYYDLGGDAVDYQGLEGPTWDGRWSLVVSSSPDGGRSFGRGVIVDAAVVPPERVMLIFTMPPASLAAGPRGELFAAWHDARNGDWDVFVARSGGGSRSWGAPHRVNDDKVDNGRHQYLPRLAVAPDGRLDVVFYDRRGGADNVLNHVFYSSSSDGGRHFSPNRRLTTKASDSRSGQRYVGPAAKDLVDFGSRLALLSWDDRVVAAWTDTRNALASPYQDIFATQLEFDHQ